jgi:hypothetical protein
MSQLNSIVFTQNDTAVLTLFATDGSGNPINLTAATFSSQILGPGGVPQVFGNSQHAIVSAANGEYTLSLTQANTAACGLGANKSILTTITVGSAIVTYQGMGILTVLAAVPLQ